MDFLLQEWDLQFSINFKIIAKLMLATSFFSFFLSWNKYLISLTFASTKIFLTASEISGPIPSPGMRVQVCLDRAWTWIRAFRNNFDIFDTGTLKQTKTCRLRKSRNSDQIWARDLPQSEINPSLHLSYKGS